jgi:hypothetical protein
VAREHGFPSLCLCPLRQIKMKAGSVCHVAGKEHPRRAPETEVLPIANHISEKEL